MSTSIHHIAIAVHDLDSALTLYRDGLGLEATERREVPEEGVEIAFLPAGEGEIELIQPLDENSSVARFLEKNGEGLHHICLAVEDIEAAMTQLQLSARAYHRILKLTRTIADLACSEEIRPPHLAEAIQCRPRRLF